MRGKLVRKTSSCCLFEMFVTLFTLSLTLITCQAASQVPKSGQLELTGWRKIDFPPKKLEEYHRLALSPIVDHSQRESPGKVRFVEWDDDESHEAIKQKEDPSRIVNSILQRPSSESTADGSELERRWHKSRDSLSSRYNKLVFHGQVRANESIKSVDGVKLHINIKQPVEIIRGDPLERSRPNFQPAAEDEESSELRPIKVKDPLWPEEGKSGALSKSSSDWKPIVVPKVARSATKMVIVDEELKKKPLSLRKPGDIGSAKSNKWKPVKQEKMTIRSTDSNRKSTIVESSTGSTISEPFDDVVLVTARLGDLNNDEEQKSKMTNMKKRGSKSISHKGSGSSWKPLETVTTFSAPEVTTTTASSITTMTSLFQNASESAQKSASDINYIYSQAMPTNQQLDWQPSQSRQQSAGAGYYSTYLTQPTQQVSMDPQPSAIIDTSSGQTPEMISDRQPDMGTAIAADYPAPQMSSSYQPTRQTSYGSYDVQSYVPSRPQPTRQLASQPVVRQEHHYHYYNQNPQRQQNSDGQADRSSFASQQPSIIREIQPVVISQPIIQQQATTASPPQSIIREIIKEVPITQTIQQIQAPIPRIISPPPITIPLSPASRDLDSVYGGYPSSAQRIMRQISSSVPSVSIRMPVAPAIPVVPQIRLPLPSIQLPVRLTASPNLAPVTRQTGSFLIPPMPKKTTTYLTETQAVPTHTTIMHTTQFTPATRTTVYTTDHQAPQTLSASTSYRRRRK